MPNLTAAHSKITINTSPKYSFTLLFGAIAYGCFMFVLYYRSLISLEYLSDFQSHIKLLETALTGKIFLPSNPGFYLSCWLVAGFSHQPSDLFMSGIIVLALAAIAKFYASGWLLRLVAPNVSTQKLLAVCALANLLITADWYKEMLIGNISPNVVHNSTINMSMPFAILVFGLSLQWAVKDLLRVRQICILSALIVIGMLMKPSFFMAYAIWYPIWIFWQHRKLKAVLAHAAPVLVVALVLGFQFLYQYHFIPLSSDEISNPSRVVASFPYGWYKTYLPQGLRGLYRNVIITVCLPICGAWVLRHYASPPVKAAWLLMGVAFCIFLVFGETGYRMTHANFVWQAVASLFLLELIVNAKISEVWHFLPRSNKFVYLSVLAYYILFTLLYYGRSFITGAWQ